MKRFFAEIMIGVGCASTAWAAAPATLTTLHAVHELSNAEASLHYPVAFEATVIYFVSAGSDLNVQEGDEAIFVRAKTKLALVPGDRVLVRGTSQPSFVPIVSSSDITLLRHGAPPAPVPASFDDLVRVPISCRLVRVHGVIRTTDLTSSVASTSGRFQLLMDGGYVELDVGIQDVNAFNSLLDAEVEVTGAAGRFFDSKMQQTGVKIKVSTLADIKVLKRANASPWILPITPMNEIITGTHVRDMTQRLRVHGTITYYQSGVGAVLQNGARSLWISTQTVDPLQIGDVADATGFPDTRDGRLALTYAEIKDSHTQAPITPQPANWHQLARWAKSSSAGHQNDLVSTVGQVVTEVREASQDEYVLASDGKLFTAIYRHPLPPSPLLPMLQVPLGSTIRVTGICLSIDTNPFNDEAPFDILLRSFNDIEIVAKPSLMNIRNLILAVSLLLLLVMAVSAWGWMLRSKVNRQTATLATMAQFEQRRSHILEKINGSDPLAGIIEEITQLVSSTLNGAACWCEISGGATLGYCPPRQQSSLRVFPMKITGHSGATLGIFYAGLEPLASNLAKESEALSAGVRLAALAIETRRLYTDLRRRSEFDLLTNIPNRFAMDKMMDGRIEEAKQTASLLALIYIDLDKFKLINDQYGHHVGDLFLQEVAARMKRQLRGGDMLARLGGDEFAALITVVRNRAQVEEIARRLERSFDDPFVVEGYLLHGAASIGIALYPEDGATKDSLLSAADAAMYLVKNERKMRLQTEGVETRSLTV